MSMNESADCLQRYGRERGRRDSVTASTRIGWFPAVVPNQDTSPDAPQVTLCKGVLARVTPHPPLTDDHLLPTFLCLFYFVIYFSPLLFFLAQLLGGVCSLPDRQLCEYFLLLGGRYSIYGSSGITHFLLGRLI